MIGEGTVQSQHSGTAEVVILYSISLYGASGAGLESADGLWPFHSVISPRLTDAREACELVSKRNKVLLCGCENYFF